MIWSVDANLGLRAQALPVDARQPPATVTGLTVSTTIAMAAGVAGGQPVFWAAPVDHARLGMVAAPPVRARRCALRSAHRGRRRRGRIGDDRPLRFDHVPGLGRHQPDADGMSRQGTRPRLGPIMRLSRSPSAISPTRSLHGLCVGARRPVRQRPRHRHGAVVVRLPSPPHGARRPHGAPDDRRSAPRPPPGHRRPPDRGHRRRADQPGHRAGVRAVPAGTDLQSPLRQAADLHRGRPPGHGGHQGPPPGVDRRTRRSPSGRRGRRLHRPRPDLARRPRVPARTGPGRRGHH